MVVEQNQASSTAAAAATDNQHDEQSHQRRTSSYRILGTFTPKLDAEVAESTAEEEDPMAWADLVEFGGTKTTLEKKPPVKTELSPEEIRAQLAELREIEAKMAEGANEKRSKKSMFDAIAWLKENNQQEEEAANKDKRKRSSSFVRSVLDFFHVGSHHKHHHHSNNKHTIEEHESKDKFPPLAAPWAQSALSCDWTELGFKLLNQAIVEDIARVRHVVESGELQTASPQAIIALAKWLRAFDQHVDYVETLKQYLLEERTVLAGVGYKVTTLYDVYRETLAHALEKIHGDDRGDLGDAILQTFVDLEAILRDEIAAVKDVIKQTLIEDQEYTALSQLFHHLCADEACGVVVAKLLGWMKNNLEDTEVHAFLALFDSDVKSQLAGEWMRHYASYLQLLDEFAVNYDASLAFFT